MSECAICGSHGPSRIREGVRDHLTGDVFRLLQCARCGFAATDPVPPSLERYYPAHYRRFSGLASALLRRLYLRRVAGWHARLPSPGIALEIGSGTGWMLGALRERGWRAVGSERTVGAAAAAREIARVPMFVGDLDAVRAAPTADLVVMFHVLEHLADPVSALRAAAARLRPGGALILGLPNIASWQARVAGARWLHLDVPRHLCHFSPEAIERAVALSGLRLTHIDTRSLEHDPLGWVQAALDRLGFEEGILLKMLTGTGRPRSGPVAKGAVILLLPLLGAIGLVLAVASWRARAGAVMEVWAMRPREG